MLLPVRIACCVLALIAFAAPIRAAHLAPAQTRTAPRPPQLVVAVPGERPVVLESLRIRVDVTGARAQTEVEMTFLNPNGRILEGELDFPLLDGQAVVGFALDVDGKLRAAVPIEKARGQAVFEDVVRGQVDPGLLQQTQGNNFKLRLYPLPPQGRRHVSIRYAETLQGDDRTLAYRLPLQYVQQLDRFDLDIRVAGSRTTPVAKASAIDALSFERQGRYFTTRIERSRFTPRGMLEVQIPRDPVGSVYTQSLEGRTWFYVDMPVDTRVAPRPRPKIVGIVWDASGSGSNRDHERELALLDAYLRWLGDAEVRLTVVRDSAEPVHSFEIRAGQWQALRAFLTGLPYDGATNLGSFEPQADVDEYLLFSDGLSNFGARSFPRLAQSFHTISSSMRADPDWLRVRAHASGGRHIDLLTASTADAARMLMTQGTRITALSGEGTAHLVMSSPYPEYGRVLIAGELLASSGRITVQSEGAGGRNASRVEVLPDAASTHSAGTVWAQLRIAELAGDYVAHRSEILRLGKTFGIVTRETSLIVLERLQDYVRHEIVPPAELRAQYDRLRQAATLAQARDRGRHLDDIVRRFVENARWWETKFPLARIAPKEQAERSPASVTPESRLATPRRSVSSIEMREDAGALRRDAPAARAAAPAGNLGTAQSSRASKHSASAATGPIIRLTPFTPQGPFMRKLRDASADEAYAVYLAERQSQALGVAFYLDVADALFAKQLHALGIRVLSNLAEMDLENRHILRVLGHRLMQAEQTALAVSVFERVLAVC